MSEPNDARPRERLQVLNLYSGLGGNRKLWPDTVDVTAVEINPDIADYYAEQFPEDEVIVADAHEYLKENHEQFDYVWSSVPCQTHSRVSWMAWASDAPQNEDRDPDYPDMRLYQEILFLDNFFQGDWAVENVISYYTPLVDPQTVATHYIWSNYHIPKFDFEGGPGAWTNPPMEKFEEYLGFDLSGYEFDGERKDQLLRNCVDPKVGKHVFDSRSKQQKLPITTGGGARPKHEVKQAGNAGESEL